MDTTSRKTGTRAYSFIAHPLDGPALRFSAVVMSNHCLAMSEHVEDRRNMFDPMLFEGCELAPNAAATFKASESPSVLVRLYPPDARLSKLILKQWKAYVYVDRAENVSPLPITSAEVRGLVASGKLILSQMRLKPGTHQLSVLFDAPGMHPIRLNTEFSISP